MPPKKQPGASEKAPKRKRVPLTLEEKKEIIEKFESGTRVHELARLYGRNHSTICTLIKQKEEIKKADTAKGRTTLSSPSHRPPQLEEVEKLLMVWINEKKLRADRISEEIIREKALKIFHDLKSRRPTTSTTAPTGVEDFKASLGWFTNFRRRSGLHSVLPRGEAASSDSKAAEKYVAKFKKFVDKEGFLPQQVFNADETGLFWKKMPRRTYITAEEKSLPGHKPMKDRLTLLLCANATGDCKIKPLLVYHSAHPRAFKRNNISIPMLPVMWRSNNKAWVTRHLFREWIDLEFAPAVKKYLRENNLPRRALLVLDNAPAHPPDLDHDLAASADFITVKYLPPNTTPLLQPMDQQVIANFKKLYTKFLFRKCFNVTDSTNIKLRDFWKDHFNVLGAIRLIKQAWDEVTVRTLVAAWQKLWPAALPAGDFDGIEAEPDEPVVPEIVSLGRSLGLQVSDDDVNELVEEHGQELSTDDLQHLKQQQQEEAAEEAQSSSKEEAGEGRISKVPAAKIKQWLRNWEDVQECLVTYHPDKIIVFDGINILEKAFEYFRASVKKRVRQQTMDKFLLGPSAKRARVSEPQPGTSSALDPSARSVSPDSDSQLQPSPSGIVSARQPPRCESDSDSDSEEPGQSVSDSARQPPRKALVGVSDSDSDPDDPGIMEGDSPSKQH